MKTGNIRVLIADDHSLYRSGLKLMLSGLKNISVIGEATNGQELLRRNAELCPDIILTDIVMPVMDGIHATRELARRKQAGRVIVLSALGREDTILQMLEAGALGYVMKSAEAAEIEEAISAVYHNKPYFCREITALLTEIVSRNPPPGARINASFTEREKEIMKHICNEATSKEIAHAMHLSTRTVEGHRTRIMDKIGAKSIAGIITYAVEKGLNK